MSFYGFRESPSKRTYPCRITQPNTHHLTVDCTRWTELHCTDNACSLDLPPSPSASTIYPLCDTSHACSALFAWLSSTTRRRARQKINSFLPPSPCQQCGVTALRHMLLSWQCKFANYIYRGAVICSSLVDRCSAVTLRVSQSQQRPHSAANHATWLRKHDPLSWNKFPHLCTTLSELQ